MFKTAGPFDNALNLAWLKTALAFFARNIYFKKNALALADCPSGGIDFGKMGFLAHRMDKRSRRNNIRDATRLDIADKMPFHVGKCLLLADQFIRTVFPKCLCAGIDSQLDLVNVHCLGNSQKQNFFRITTKFLANLVNFRTYVLISRCRAHRGRSFQFTF